MDHLEILFETKLRKDNVVFDQLYQKLNILGKKLTNFLNAVELNYNEFEV